MTSTSKFSTALAAPRPGGLPGGRRRFLTLMAGATLLATSACGLSAPEPASQQSPTGPLVIGMSLPLTGPVADRAKPGMEGYQYWVDEVNAKGGLLGRQVQLKVMDDGFDQQTAISDYNKLISQDKVDLVLGTTGHHPAAAQPVRRPGRGDAGGRASQVPGPDPDGRSEHLAGRKAVR